MFPDYLCDGVSSYCIFIHKMVFRPLCLSRGSLYKVTCLPAHEFTASWSCTKCYIWFYIYPHLFSSSHMETTDGRSCTFSDTH